METLVIILALWFTVQFADNQVNGDPPEQNQIERRYEMMGWELPKEQE